MLVVIPFAEFHATQVEALIRWINDLGGCENRIIFVSTKSSLPFAAESLKWELVSTPFALKDESHPIGPNWMFETALKHFARKNETQPFLWLEPDAIPVRKGWLQEIEAEYELALRRGKSILAHVAKLGDPRFPKEIPSGTAVYPGNAWKRFYSRLQTNRRVAWDIQFADAVRPHVFPSKTIFNRLNRKAPPTFVENKSVTSPKNAMTLGELPRTCALFHPCKDGSLIEVIRARIHPSAVQILTAWRENRTSPVEPVRVDDCLKSAPTRFKYIHVVERHAQRSKPDEERVLRAVNSWIALYKTGRLIPCHVWDYPRHSGEIGDSRKLPFLKDLLVEGMSKTKDDNDVIVWTNDDTVLHSQIILALGKVLTAVDACGSMRMNFDADTMPKPTTPVNKILETGKIDLGRDVFAFRKRWLKKYWHQIPDFFVGELEFDLVLTALIRQSAGFHSDRHNITDPCPQCEIPRGYVLHEKHERAWVSPAFAESPAKNYNRKLAVQFYSRHQLPSMISTT